jgi:hypothetical protein
MPYGTITGSDLTTYAPRQPGYYVKSDLTYADPANEFRITGASPNKGGSLSGAVTRLLQKDVEVNGKTSRQAALVSLSISVPQEGHFTAAELDVLVADISEFLSPEHLSRLLQGEK